MPRCADCRKLVGMESLRRGLCDACERKRRGLKPLSAECASDACEACAAPDCPCTCHLEGPDPDVKILGEDQEGP
jgi:hypothetical protein